VGPPDGAPGEPAVGFDDKAEAEPPDAAWRETYCGEVPARLKHKAPFERDGVLCRETRESPAQSRAARKKLLARDKGQAVGPFHRLSARFLNTDHPSRRLTRGPRGGSGTDGSGGAAPTAGAPPTS
jgi:hypothetical protein